MSGKLPHTLAIFHENCIYLDSRKDLIFIVDDMSIMFNTKKVEIWDIGFAKFLRIAFVKYSEKIL